MRVRAGCRIGRGWRGGAYHFFREGGVVGGYEGGVESRWRGS